MNAEATAENRPACHSRQHMYILYSSEHTNIRVAFRSSSCLLMNCCRTLLPPCGSACRIQHKDLLESACLFSSCGRDFSMDQKEQELGCYPSAGCLSRTTSPPLLRSPRSPRLGSDVRDQDVNDVRSNHTFVWCGSRQCHLDRRSLGSSWIQDTRYSVPCSPSEVLSDNTLRFTIPTLSVVGVSRGCKV